MIHAHEARIALLPVDDPTGSFRQADRPLGAGRDTGPAGAAVDIPRHQLRRKALRFGIGAPGAGKRTAFEKYSGSDARPVMHAEFLNIKDDAPIVVGQTHLSLGNITLPLS